MSAARTTFEALEGVATRAARRYDLSAFGDIEFVAFGPDQHEILRVAHREWRENRYAELQANCQFESTTSRELLFDAARRSLKRLPRRREDPVSNAWDELDELARKRLIPIRSQALEAARSRFRTSVLSHCGNLKEGGMEAFRAAGRKCFHDISIRHELAFEFVAEDFLIRLSSRRGDGDLIALPMAEESFLQSIPFDARLAVFFRADQKMESPWRFLDLGLLAPELDFASMVNSLSTFHAVLGFYAEVLGILLSSSEN